MRLGTARSIRCVKSYDDGYGLYAMDISYKYDLDRIIARGMESDAAFAQSICREALPLVRVKLDVPDFGCTAFSFRSPDGGWMMGRNYDFKFDTSSMMVRCRPKNGFRSIAFAAMDNIGIKNPKTFRERMSCLVAPFICLDGINEKGVSIAVLTLDSKPTVQCGDRPFIATTFAIRLVLDRADSTEKAVELLGKYNMFANSGRDYHFFITDASGDSRVVEYDCESETREMVVTRSDRVTNFFVMYADRVLPNRRNGVYGHGRERYDAVGDVLSEPGEGRETGWKGLKATQQLPNPEDVTSNTQWSIVFDNASPGAEICLRRHWEDRFPFEVRRCARLGIPWSPARCSNAAGCSPMRPIRMTGSSCSTCSGRSYTTGSATSTPSTTRSIPSIPDRTRTPSSSNTDVSTANSATPTATTRNAP